MVIFVLAILGLAAGSFINALVWRLHEHITTGKKSQKMSISRGRSMCPNCRHELAAKDLLPVVSWLMLKGRCRYCYKKISIQYPLVELAMAAVFVISYLAWPASLDSGGQKILLASWLISSVGLLALLVYDYKWLLLPNRLIYPTLAVALAGRLAYIIFYSPNPWHDWLLLATGLLVTSGIFWLLYSVSGGRWIGFGDVRLGLITGCLLASPSLGLLMIFLASILGLATFLLGAFGQKKSLSQKIPFGPFLITSSWLVILFGQSILNWYTNLFTSHL